MTQSFVENLTEIEQEAKLKQLRNDYLKAIEGNRVSAKMAALMGSHGVSPNKMGVLFDNLKTIQEFEQKILARKQHEQEEVSQKNRRK